MTIKNGKNLKFKNEKGSVTVFVLISILFFIIVLAGVYIAAMNRMEAQENNTKEIIKSYDKDAELIYQNLTAESVRIVFTNASTNEIHSSNSWTRDNLIVSVYYPDDTPEWERLISIDGSEFYKYTGEELLTQKTTVKAKVLNKKEKTAIARIDKDAPTYTIDPANQLYISDKITDTADVSMRINAVDGNGSGIKKVEYAFVKGDEIPDSYIQVANNSKIAIPGQTKGTYYVWFRITDKAGNQCLSKEKVEIKEYVAKVGETLYVTLQEAIDACPSNGTNTKIEILRNVKENTNCTIPAGKNITLELDGNRIIGTGTIITNNGTLKVVDSSSTATGTIETTDGVAIISNSVFTLGENEGSVNQLTPKIIGTTNGIINNGIFNFYDGGVIGEKAVIGSIDDLPEKYSAISKKNENREEIYLGILAESAARIGEYYYSSLAEAFNEASSGDEETTTIILLKNIILTSSVEVGSDKNTRLDLAGYTISNANPDYVIKNYGTLEIVDNSEAQTGSIIGVNYSAVYNGDDSNLVLSSGKTILQKAGSNSSTYMSAVMNLGNCIIQGNTTIETTTSTYTYAVNNQGDVQFNAGEINAKGIGIYTNSVPYWDTENENVEEVYTAADLENKEKEEVEYVKYYFYDDGTGKFVPNNKSEHSTTANSYIKIDLTEKTGNYNIKLNAQISSESGFDFGYATITETIGTPSYSSTTGRFMYITGNYSAQDYTSKTLTGGKIYYLYLGYRKDGSVNGGEDKVTFNSIKLIKQDESEIKEYEESDLEKPIDTINVKYYMVDDGTGKLVPENSGIANTTALSYMTIDLTDKVGTYRINVNASVSSSSGNDYGYATILDYLGNPAYNNSTGRFMYISGEYSDASYYSKELTGGNIYYLYLGYRKSSSNPSGQDKVTINSVTLEKKRENGTITMNGGSITASTGIYSNSKNETTINAGTINTTAYGIYNANIGSISFNNGSIVSDYSNNVYGIYNYSTGTVNVKNGSISIYKDKTSTGTNIWCGLYNNSTGIINIGENDGTISTTSPEIYGYKYAVYNNTGSMNYYDGVLGGKEITGGNITAIPDKTEIEISTDANSIKTGILGISKGPIAQIGDVTYEKLQDAFNAVPENGETATTVELLRDFVVYNETDKPTVEEGKNIYLETNGHICDLENSGGILNNGTLEIGNKVETYKTYTIDDMVAANSTYYFEADENGIIYNNNKDKLNSYTTALSYIEIDLTSEAEDFYVSVNMEIKNMSYNSYGYATITESLTSPGYNNPTGRFIYTSGEGDIEAQDYIKKLTHGKKYYLYLGYYKYSTSIASEEVMKINNIKLQKYSEIVTPNSNSFENYGTLKIKDNVRVINNNVSKYFVNNYGTFELNGGRLENDKSVYVSSKHGIHNNANAIVNINSGYLYMYGYYLYGIYNYSTGVINVNGGVIELEVNGYNRTYCIYNYSTGTININGGRLYNNSSYYKYGVYNTTGKITMNGGVIDNSPYSSYSSYGIYNNGNAELEFNGGTIKLSYYGNGIYNNSTGNIRILNLNILSRSYRIKGIYNQGTGNIDIKNINIEITGNGDYTYGIYNNSTGNINLEEGNIQINSTYTTCYGIYNNSSATINLGLNDGNVSKTSPKIECGYGGIYNSTGIFNFYDGIIKGNIAITGEITEIATGADIITETQGSIETKYLDDSPVAEIGTVQYKTLQEAFDAVPDNQEDATTVKILRNITIINEDYKPVIVSTKNINIDLNGYKITANNESGIENQGTLRFSSSKTYGSIEGNKKDGITNEGNLVLDSTIQIIQRAAGSAIYNTGITNISGTNIQTLNSGAYGITNDEDGTVEVNDAVISTYYGYGIANEASGTVDFNNSTIKYYQYIGTYGITNNGSGTINYNNGTIAGYNYGIQNNSSGTINVNSGIINNVSVGITNNGQGIINVNSGEITVNTSLSYPTYYSYGIWNKSTGSVILGKDDGEVSTESPKINNTYSGSISYGVYNENGNFEFYDGQIKGQQSIAGDINKVPSGYRINKEVNGNYITSTLIVSTPEAKVGDTIYNTLQEAFDATPDNNSNETTVTLLRDITILNEASRPIIRENKNIYLNSNSFIIEEGNTTGIENNGKLRIGNNEQTENLMNSELKSNSSSYYFIKDETGALIPNTSKYAGSITTNSYIEIDLTDKLGNYIVTINAEVSSRQSYDYGYATITENNSSPSYSTSTGRFVYISGEVSAKDYTTELTGGKKYYLHLGYRKYNSSYSGEDRVKFNSIEIKGTGKINSYRGNGISNNGELKISDGVIIDSINSSGAAIENNGILEVNGGRIVATRKNSETNKTYAILNKEAGKLTMNDGTIYIKNTAYYGYNSYGIYNDNGDITINGGNLSHYSLNGQYGSCYLLYNAGNTDIIINGGTLYTDYGYDVYTYGIYNNMNGNIVINDIDMNITGYYGTYGIYNNSEGEITFKRGLISTYTRDSYDPAYGIYNKGGKINIENGIIKSMSYNYSTYGIYNEGTNMYTGEINISGGRIESKMQYSNSYASYGIYTTGAIKINMEGGEILAQSPSNAYGIYNYNNVNYSSRAANIDITGGNIKAEQLETTSSSTYNIYGIYMDNKYGLIKIGENDSNVSITSPIISATGRDNTYGLFNSQGSFYFYDGAISGKITIFSNITEMAPGYEIYKETVNEVSTDILTIAPTDNSVCTMNSVNYSSVKDAIERCTDSETYTISLITSSPLSEAIIIPSGKNIILSINGYNISYNGAGATIINNGTLTIKDTNIVSSGEIRNDGGMAILNNGTLIIGENDDKISIRSPKIIGTTTAITNSGSIQFYDGTITAQTPISGTSIGTIASDCTLTETEVSGVKTLSLIGTAPEVTYRTETISGGTKIIVTATDTNLSKIINPDNTEVVGTETQITSEYVVTGSGTYIFKAVDEDNNITTLNVTI